MDNSILIKNLENRGYKTFFVNNINQANDLILKLIPVKDSTGFGGSQTIKTLGIHKSLKERGNTVYHRELMPNIDRMKVMLDASRADWFISSTNAITYEGELVNTDGIGNRISSMVFGGANTIIVCGTNKIVPDINSAIERIRTKVAGKNCERLHINNPCVYGGDCADCKAESSICRATTIINYPPMAKKFYVIIVNEELGF